MHKIQVAILILIFPLGLLYWYVEKNDIPFSSELFYPGQPVVHIGEIPMQVEIADSALELQKGLSGRRELTSVKGLLMVFPEAGYHGIWMKDMLFPIDIIWVSADLKVIGIERNVSPDTYPKSFRPVSPAKYVIETNANYSETFGITTGKSVRLPLQVENN